LRFYTTLSKSNAPSTSSFLLKDPRIIASAKRSTTTGFSSSLETDQNTWQENLDDFLDPFTSPDKKQIILSDLINANSEIRDSLQSAFEERNIDPILTPRAKKLQEGTKTVARQIRTDIIPQISKSVSNPSKSNNNKKKLVSLEDIPNITNRIFSETSTQVQKNVEQFTQDLADPSRIPERISKQSQDIANEVQNIFRDTPEGLKGPPYKLITKREGSYEIRDYDAFIAASTTMSDDGEDYSFDDLSNSGNGFNTLASYLFGKNKEDKALSMTTPVAVTNKGEMQFYLYNDDSTPSTSNDDFPAPLAVDETDPLGRSVGEVNVKEISQCRLAVARFTGFVTDGEVSRQKEALLQALKEDGLEVDIDINSSSNAIPHIIFQYNPPYTLPVFRRNEIAIPVKKNILEDVATITWDDAFLEDGDGMYEDVSPSDG